MSALRPPTPLRAWADAQPAFRTRAATLRASLAAASLLALAGCGGSSDAGTGSHGGALPSAPNIVVVIADDLGYGDLGCFGSTAIATPRIDELAGDGARLTSFYAQSVCTPTRASFLTGRYARRLGMTAALGPWALEGLDPAEETVAEVLRGANYRTALFGKWHVGDSPDQLPTAQGFDEFVGLPWGPTGIPVVELDSRSGKVTVDPDPTTQTQRATDAALDFIARCRSETPERPFFCVVSYVAPHEPAAASLPFRGTSQDARDYGDAVEELDAAVGRLVDDLDARALGGSTLVLFFSDNGAATGGDPYHNGSNGPLRGGKGSTFEGGVRVPAVARWVGAIARGVAIAAPMHVVDLLPSFAALARAPLPALPLDGENLARVLIEPGATPPAERFLHFSENGRFNAVRQGRFKLREGALYDLAADLGETTDVTAGHPAVAAELAAELARIEAEAVADPAGRAPTTRVVRRWSPSLGPAAPSHLVAWPSTRAAGSTLVLVDDDPAVDLVRVAAPPGLESTLSGDAYAYTAPSEGLRWEHLGTELDPFGAFTLTLRYLPPAGGAGEPLALLDIGDAVAGLSLTLGDAGILGDDSAPGRLDDLRLVIGGSAARAASVALDVDLPNGPRGVHVAIVRDASGAARLYLDGVERASAPAPAGGPLDAGLLGTWALGSPAGALGGAGAPTGPFAATRAAGTFGDFALIGRAVGDGEAALERCRYLRYDACHALPNSTGAPARLDLAGSFRAADRALEFRVSDAPPGATAVLMVSTAMARSPFGMGFLCLAEPIEHLTVDAVTIGPDGTATFTSPAFHDLPATAGSVRVQVRFTDEASGGAPTTNTTNAIVLTLCAN